MANRERKRGIRIEFLFILIFVFSLFFKQTEVSALMAVQVKRTKPEKE